MAFVVGDSIETDKGTGEIAYIGEPEFSEGVWVGIVLQKPNGKNNGIVQGKKYFDCPELHGIFYKQNKLLEFVTSNSASRKTSRLSSLSSGTNLHRQAGSSKTSPSLTPSESRESLASKSRQSSFYGKPPTASSSGSNIGKPKSTTSSPKSAPEPEVVKKQEENALPPSSIQAVPSSPGLNSSTFGAVDMNDFKDLKSERDDLIHKLQTVKEKRRQDLTKLKEYELMLVQVKRLESHKEAILKEHSDLKNKYQEAKKEIIDLKANITAASNGNSSSFEAEELLESLTTEKEMLEEKNEQLESEVQALRQKLQDIESGTFSVAQESENVNGDGNVVVDSRTPEESMKRIKVLEDAVQRLRDIIFNYDDYIKDTKLENQQLRDDLTHFEDIAATLKFDIDEKEKTISQLQDQVDSALGNEMVIEHLSFQILGFEEKAREVEQMLSDYETTTRLFDELQDYHEDLKKSHVENIASYEEALVLAKAENDRVKEMIREADSTVIKFQRKVTEMNEQLQEKEDEILRLQESLMVSVDGDNNGGTFATMNNNKSFTDTVNSEVAQLELAYAKENIKFLSSFLPDNFFKPGADSDLLHVHLSFPRIAAKTKLLRTLLHLKYPDVPGGIRREHVTKSHRAEQWASVDRFEYALASLYTIVTKLNSIAQTSSVERMSKLALQKHDIAQQEKQLDNFFGLLRNHTLDENTCPDNIDRATLFFTKTCAIYLSTDVYNTTEFIQNTVAQFQAGFKWLQKDLKRLELALMPTEAETGDFVDILNQFSKLIVEADAFAIHVNNSLPTDKTFVITAELSDNLQSAMSELDKANRTLYQTCSTVASKLCLSFESEGLLTSQMHEVFQNSVEKNYGNAHMQDSARPIIESLRNICSFFGELAKNVDSDLLFSPRRDVSVFPPIVNRAQVRKEDAAEAEGMRWEIKKKNAEIVELNKIIKTKMNELSAMRCRLELAAQKVVASYDEAALANVKAMNDVAEVQRKAIEEYKEIVEIREREIADLKEELDGCKSRDHNDSMQQLMNTLSSTGKGTSIGTNDLNTMNKRNAALLLNLHKQKNNEMLSQISSLPPIRVSNSNVSMFNNKPKKSSNDLTMMLRHAHDLSNSMNVALVQKSVLKKGPHEHLNKINTNVDQLYSQFTEMVALIKAA